MQEFVASHTMLRKRDVFLYIYVLCMCLYIYTTADVLWLEPLPLSAICLLTIILSIVKIVQLKGSISQQQFILCSCFFLYFFLSFFFWNWGENFFFLRLPASFLFVVSVILLPLDEKRLLFRAISKCLFYIIIISVPVWLLFVAGFDLPHSDVIFHPNGFHQYYDYHFFRLNAKNDDIFDLILPRFSSVFLEPGQLATPCAFIFFLSGSKLNRKTLPFVLAIFLSFSLIGLVLLMGCYVARKIVEKGRKALFQLVLSFVLLGGVLVYFSLFVDEENPVNMFVTSRLVYDEDKGIEGNNRTTHYFDRKFEAMMQSSDRYMGQHERLKEGSDWSYNCSGYKKFIVHHGLIGFGLFMMFILLLLFYNWSKPNFFFFMIIVLAFFVRDLLQSPLWLSIAIVGFGLLGKESKEYIPQMRL